MGTMARWPAAVLVRLGQDSLSAAAAACVYFRQEAACPAAAAVGLGQTLLLGIVPTLSVPIPG
eukprot:1018176-Pyramimonas_sp.AAC.1